MNVRMIAIRQLCHGSLPAEQNIPPGGEFEVDEDEALQLEANGQAYRKREPKAKTVHPNKMLRPLENK